MKVHLLDISDSCLSSFSSAEIDIASIVDWANCPNEDARLRRIHFVETFPAFVPMLVFRPDDPFSEEIQGWIDRGEPLIENIALLMGDVNKETVEFLVGKPLSLISANWIEAELEMLFALDCLSPGRRPQTKKEWNLFNELESSLSPLSWDTSGYVFEKIFSSGYKSIRKKLLEVTDGDLNKLRWINNHIAFFRKWAESVADRSWQTNKAVTCAMRFNRKRHGLKSVIKDCVSDLFSGYPVVELFLQSALWRAKFQEAVANAQAQTNDPELVQWPALLRHPFVANSVRVTSVGTIEELLNYGRVLKPFLDNFVELCSLGNYHCVVLHDQRGSHIGTAAIDLSGPEGGMVFPYVRAHHRLNGEYAYLPESDVLDALDAWLRHPDQQHWLLEFVQYVAARREGVEQKLLALEELDFGAACDLMKGTLENYEQIFLELQHQRP